MADPDLDGDVLHRLTQGTKSEQESAQEKVADRYFLQLVKYVQKMLQGDKRISAREIAGSAFDSFIIGLAERNNRFDHAGGLWKMLVTIARHKLYDARHPKTQAIGFDADQLPSPGPTPSDPVMVAEEGAVVASIIEDVLEGLPDDYGDVLRLRLEGYTQMEIAERLGIGRSAVRHRLKRIQERLEIVMKRRSSD